MNMWAFFLHSLTLVISVNVRKLVLGCVLTLLSCVLAHADTTDFRVNDDGGVGAQSHPRIATSGSGGFVIVWADERRSGSDIYLQRYDSAANSIESNVKINDDTTGAHQSEPAIAADLLGRYSLAWKDYRNGSYPFDPAIYLQSFDSEILPQNDNLNITMELPDSLKESPDVALSPWGDGVVVWADFRNYNWDIYGQWINSAGLPTGGNFIVSDLGNPAQQHAPRVSFSSQGWFVVVWYDNRTGNDDIYVQRFDSLGNKAGTSIRVNTDNGGARQAFPDVATDGAGRFTVVWVDWRNGTYPANPDIYARKYDTSLTPLTAEIKVNTDGTTRAQREPTISADRRGNVAIIWSDSTGNSWDINGQMIDVEGMVRETNFRANSNGDSAQLQADVALDGRYRYVTWTDKRNGNWDIYASISKYNDPTLVPTPATLRFEILVGGELPEPQLVTVEHAGYNPLHFEVTSSTGWCRVLPSSGLTPDTVSVSIIDSSLLYGSHVAALTFIDLDNGDSSVVLPVRLDVTAPLLQLSADTVRFDAFHGITDSVVAELSVTNAGSGSFEWTATESADWLVPSQVSGVPPSSLQLITVCTDLIAGRYVEPVVFDADNALGAPDTVWAILDVYDNQPYIYLQPDSLYVQTADADTVREILYVQNLGAGELSWKAVSSDTWLHVDPTAGLGNDSLILTIRTADLTPGRHVTSVEVLDSAAFNSSQMVPFVLDLQPPILPDTLEFGSVHAVPGGSAVIPIELELVNHATEIAVPMAFEPTALTIDSVVFDPVIVNRTTTYCSIDSVRGTVLIIVDAGAVDSTVSPGRYLLAQLHVAVGNQEGRFPLDTISYDSISARVITNLSDTIVPVVTVGEITIDSPTGIESSQIGSLPREVVLSQCFPNPFNLGTSIDFDLPRRLPILLEIYNILGQKIATLAQGLHEPGHHTTEWNGLSDNGQTAPSGIYFCRLRVAGSSLVSKMALVK